MKLLTEVKLAYFGSGKGLGAGERASFGAGQRLRRGKIASFGRDEVLAGVKRPSGEGDKRLGGLKRESFGADEPLFGGGTRVARGRWAASAGHHQTAAKTAKIVEKSEDA